MSSPAWEFSPNRCTPRRWSASSSRRRDSEEALGSTGSLMKAVLLPRLRETREKLSNLAPGEQDQLADGVEQALREASPADRKSFLEGLGAGFFPPGVVEKVRARVR